MESQAQTVCAPDELVGPNLVINPGFELGDQDFEKDISCSWNDLDSCGICHNNSYSQPDQYYIGNRPNEPSPCGGTFQSGFVGSPHTGDKFMMIDGQGSASPTVWQQTVVVEPESFYYFQVWVSTIGSNPVTLAELKFDIAGEEQDTLIFAPANVNEWVSYTQIWYSGTNSGPIDIKIIDIQTASTGNDRDDFGLDDIVFRKGCPPEAFLNSPELGPDQTFCGTDGTITLDAGVTPTSINHIYWSTGVNDDDSTIDVTVPGTYYVCVGEYNSCIKVDSITIRDDYTVNLGSDIALCDPAAVTLDAEHSGIGVTYQWYKDNVAVSDPFGKSQTLYVNSSGEYKVVVDDVNCDQETDSVNISMFATQPDPNNVDFCLNNDADTTIVFSVSPSGTNYKWYDDEDATILLASGTDSCSKSGIVFGDTLWVKDVTIQSLPTTGPSSPSGAGWDWDQDPNHWNSFGRKFDALSDLTLKTVDMAGRSWAGPCGGNNTTSAGFNVELYQNGSPLSPAVTATGLTVHCTNSSTSLSTVTLNFNIPAGTGYELVPKSAGGIIYDGNGSFGVNKNGENGSYTIDQVLEIQAQPNEEYSGNSYINSGAFFNWTVDAPSTCGLVPVIAVDMCVLPVEIAYLNGEAKGKNVILFWGTASEIINDYFEIQRYQEGIFITIGRVDGEGNSTQLINYDFVDLNAPEGIMYYRIKQVDVTGEISYSDIISVTIQENSAVTLSPNPADDFATLNFNSSSEKEFLIVVYSSLGQEVQRFTAKGADNVQIGKLYEEGFYIVNVSHGMENVSLKFVKQ